jgi:hypothetical protein
MLNADHCQFLRASRIFTGLTGACVLFAVAGCSARQLPFAPTPTPTPVVTQPAPAAGLNIFINGPAVRVRQVVASRAQSRGTAASLSDPRAVVLERPLQQTPPSLAASCGEHRPGRIVRIVISTFEQGGQTAVTEERFIVDGAIACPVKLTPEDIETGNKSLQELKTQVESQVARR